MAGFTTYAQQKVIDHIRGKATWAALTCYVALFTSAPSDAGLGAGETTYTNYTRATTAAGDWTSASGTAGVNTNAISFPTCGVTGATITHFGLCDAISSVNLLAWGTCSLVVSSGITPNFAAGQLSVGLD